MKKRGYIITTSRYHYLLLTEKRRLSIYLLFAIAHKIREVEAPAAKPTTELQDRAVCGQLRKMISPCEAEVVQDYYNIVVGKPEKPSAILHIPLEEKKVIVFGELNGKPTPAEI